LGCRINSHFWSLLQTFFSILDFQFGVLQGYSRRQGLRCFIVVVTILQTLYDEQKYERKCIDYSECTDRKHFGDFAFKEGTGIFVMCVLDKFYRIHYRSRAINFYVLNNLT